MHINHCNNVISPTFKANGMPTGSCSCVLMYNVLCPALSCYQWMLLCIERDRMQRINTLPVNVFVISLLKGGLLTVSDKLYSYKLCTDYRY